MGMDWHSSGITTSVMGALKRGLADSGDELGIYICGGRGRFSRNTPTELRHFADRRGFDGEALVRTSRLAARIDNTKSLAGRTVQHSGSRRSGRSAKPGRQSELF
jgi:hypothetical protein